MADCDIIRLTVPGENVSMQIEHAPWWIRTVRNAAQYIHINFYMQTPTYSSKEKAMEYYNRDHTHTSLLGAQTNAKSVAKGLRDIKSPLADYLK